VAQTPANYRTVRLVAAVAGLLGALCAVLTPFLPVNQTTADLNWPQNGSLGSVTAPLIGYVPTELTLTVPCRVAAGLDGIDRGLDCGAPFVGNAYTAEDVERIPWNIVEAIDAFEGSDFARDALGDDVHFHLLHTARAEWRASNDVVTEWELRRNFERI